MPAKKKTAKPRKAKVLTHTARLRAAPTRLIEQWARAAAAFEGNVEPEVRASAFLMIFAEVIANADDASRVRAICWTVQKAAFAESVQGDEAMNELITTLREKHKLAAVA